MGLVRKDGYFSITDACIKHCPANFLIIRPPKLFLYYFSLGCKQVGEISRPCWWSPLGSKSQPFPESLWEGKFWDGSQSKVGRITEWGAGTDPWTRDLQEPGAPGTQCCKSQETMPRAFVILCLIAGKGRCLASHLPSSLSLLFLCWQDTIESSFSAYSLPASKKHEFKIME